MKYTRKLLLAPCVAIFTISASPSVGNTYTFFSDTVIGPFDDSQDFVMRIRTLQNVFLRASLKTYNASSGALYGEDTFSICNKFEYEITFFARGRVGVDGLRYVLSIGSASYTFNIDPLVNMEVNANAHKNNSVTFNNCCIGLQNSRKITSETYNFKDTLDYVTIDDNNAFAINEISFSYNRGDYLHYSSCYLEVNDYIGVYGNFLSRDGYKVAFPLDIVASSSSITFIPNSHMYVNKKTMEMSDYRITGYSETNQIYVPIGKEKEFESNEVRIVIEDFGFSKSKIVIPLSFFSLHKLFGACYESEYCITGGVKAW